MTIATSPLPGIKVLLIGGSGTGKTTAIRTLAEAGLQVFCIFTENSFDVLGQTDPEKIHWKYIPPMSGDLAAFAKMAQSLSMLSPKQVQESSDMTRSVQNRFMPILNAMMDFKCDRTGKSYGNAGDWGMDRALVIDSLSGLTIAATKLAVGEKYALTQPEFQITMKLIENTIMQCCMVFNCHFVMTAHAEREVDEVLGGTKIGPSTMGRKLAPVLPRYFTDVILAKRIGSKFQWDTADPQADLKARNAPIATDLPASFVPLLQQWKSRGGTFSPLAAATK